MSEPFLDANVPIYAKGAGHPLKQPCAEIVLAVANGILPAVTDAEVIQELAHRFHAIGRQAEGALLAEEFLSVMTEVLPVTRSDAERSLRLLREHPRLSPRDAIHAAVMLNHELRYIISAATRFAQGPGIGRIDPAAWRP